MFIWWICLITYLLNLFDLAMTNRLVNMYGLEIEGNPIGRWLYTYDMAWVVKVIVVGGLLVVMGACIRKRPKLAWVAYIPLVAYGLLALYHIGIMLVIR